MQIILTGWHITVCGRKSVKRSGMSQQEKADGNINFEERAKGQEENRASSKIRENIMGTEGLIGEQTDCSSREPREAARAQAINREETNWLK